MRAKGEGGGPFRYGSGWRGYVTVNGKRQYTKVLPTKALASAAKRELIQRRDEGRLVAGASGTVGQWMLHWLDNIADHADTTQAQYRWVIEAKIMPTLGAVKLSALTPEHIEQWLSGLNVSNTTKRRYLAPLDTALNVAAKRGRIGFNPVTLAELPRIRKAKTSSFSRADRDAILAAATGRNRVRWHLALTMGVRPSEALGLSWPDFDENAGTLTIRNQMLRAKGKGVFLRPLAKTEAGDRVFRLPKSLVAMLVEHRREHLLEIAQQGPDRFVFEHEGMPVALMFTQLNGRPIDVHVDTRAWRKLLDAAGLPQERRYKSRHTAATHLIVDSGGDVAVTAKILGHADPAFTYRTYVHPLAEREADLMDRLDAPAPHPAPDRADRDGHQRTPESR